MDRKKMFAVGSGVVFLGYLAGVVTVFFQGVEEGYVTRYLSSLPSPRWGQAFLSGPFFLLLTLSCGLFLFGWLIVYPLIFYKAYGFGYSAGLFLAALGAKGFLPLGLCLFPSAAAECLLLARASRDAFPQSFALFRGMKGEASSFFDSVRPYLLRSLVLFQCSSFVLLWDLFFAPLILSGVREYL